MARTVQLYKKNTHDLQFVKSLTSPPQVVEPETKKVSRIAERENVTQKQEVHKQPWETSNSRMNAYAFVLDTKEGGKIVQIVSMHDARDHVDPIFKKVEEVPSAVQLLEGRKNMFETDTTLSANYTPIHWNYKKDEETVLRPKQTIIQRHFTG